MPRRARRYAIHLMLSFGHRETIHFKTLDEFHQWYGGVLNNPSGDEFVNVPIKDFDGEYLVVRPSAVVAIRVEPEFHVLDD